MKWGEGQKLAAVRLLRYCSRIRFIVMQIIARTSIAFMVTSEADIDRSKKIQYPSCDINNER